MPVGYPSVYSVYLAKKQGPFATLGLAEDTWALNEGVINDDHFIQQCLDMDREREAMFFDALDKVPRGLVACVFDGTDRLQHTFWRDIDERAPGPARSRTCSPAATSSRISTGAWTTWSARRWPNAGTRTRC